MSNEAYDRMITRESKLWIPFVLSFPFTDEQIADRSIIFGLYSESYINGKGYLYEIEATDITNLVTDYNQKMADLSTQEQVIISTIVARRYVADIEKLVHDQKIETKAAEIQADDELWDAKMAALESDRATLNTLSAKVEAETQKIEARITELNTYIEMEGYNLSQVDIEIAEKELLSSKKDVEKLRAALEVLKIQTDTVMVGTELIDVDLKIAQIKVNIANTEVSKIKIDLLDEELEVEQAKTGVAEAEVDVAEVRKELAQAQSDGVSKDIDYYEDLISQALKDLENKKTLMNLKSTIQIDSLNQNLEERELDIENKLDVSTLEISLAELDTADDESITDIRIAVIDNNATNSKKLNLASISAAQNMAAANIVSTLTHTIRKS